jgi:tetratricopeptide (TPR) repeat protein
MTLKRKRITSAVIGSAVVVVTAALVVIKSLPVGSLVIVAVLVILAGLVFGKEILSHQETSASEEKEHLSVLRCRPQAVCDADPFSLGVTPSSIAERYRGEAPRPPYVRRDVDEHLDDEVAWAPFIAIVGPSKAGKSRTAFEAITRVLGDRTLIAPDLPGSGQEGLADAIARYVDASDNGAVVWLDDLQEYLNAGVIRIHDLNSWREASNDVTVVATMRDGELAALRAADDRAATIKQIMDQAVLVPLSPTLSAAELKKAARVYPDEDFKDGLGVHLVAGRQLVERFVATRESEPYAFAITAAAIDRSRAGISTPATVDELLDLAPGYFAEVLPRSEFDRGRAQAALKFVRDPVIQDIAMLLPVEDDPDTLEPFDYLCAFRDGEVEGGRGSTPIPPISWERLIANNDGSLLAQVGSAAFRRRELEVAKAAFEKLSEDEDPHMAAHGIADLGDTLWDLNDEERAASCYRSVANSQFGCVAGNACFALALMSERRNEDPEAWYRKAIEHPGSAGYPKALVNLALLLRSRTSAAGRASDDGDRKFLRGRIANPTPEERKLESEAKALFELALQSDDQEAVANAGNALGVMLASEEDPGEAEPPLRIGANAGSVHAKIRLAHLLASQEDRAAEGWVLWEELENDDLDPTERAYFESISVAMLERDGRIDEAIELARRLARCDHQAYREIGAFKLAHLLDTHGGDISEIRELLETLIAYNGLEAEFARNALKTLGASSGEHGQDHQ